jgi:hypothetical protein
MNCVNSVLACNMHIDDSEDIMHQIAENDLPSPKMNSLQQYFLITTVALDVKKIVVCLDLYFI